MFGSVLSALLASGCEVRALLFSRTTLRAMMLAKGFSVVSPQIFQNYLYAALLIVALFTLIVHAVDLVRKIRLHAPNLQEYDVRKGESNGSQGRNLLVLAMNVGGRPALVKSVKYGPAGKLEDAIAFSPRVVEPGKCVVVEIQDAFKQVLLAGFQGRKPSSDGNIRGDVLIEYSEVDGSHRRKLPLHPDLYPRSPVHASSTVRYWTGPEDAPKPSGWKR